MKPPAQGNHTSRLMLAILTLLLLCLWPTTPARGQITVGFESTYLTVSETNQIAALNVLRSGDPTVAFTVDYETVARDATSGADFMPQSGTLAFAAGETNHVITVPILDDGLVEPDEFFWVQLRNPSNDVTTNVNARVTVVIQDNEKPLIFDPAFNPDAQADGAIYQLAPLPDGKLLLFGGFTNVNGADRRYIARLNADGTLDYAFGANYPASYPGGNLLLQSDGKFIVPLAMGSFLPLQSYVGFGVAIRFNEDGSLDSTFHAPSGYDGVRGMCLQKDSKLLAWVYDSTEPRPASILHFIRLASSGTFETAFTVDIAQGSIVYPDIYEPVVQSGGDLLLAGVFFQNSAEQTGLLRFRPDGSLDSLFNAPSTNGSIVYARAMAIAPDDRVLVYGPLRVPSATENWGLWRLNPDGTLDPSFNSDYRDDYAFLSKSMPQADGKILLIGGGSYSRPNSKSLSRLNNDGSKDLTFLPGVQTRQFVQGDSNLIAPMADGSVVAAESSFDFNKWFARITRFASNSVDVRYIGFSATNFFVNENSTNAAILVERRGNSTASLSVRYEFLGGTAKAGINYRTNHGTLTFAPLEVTKRLPVPLLHDHISGKDKTIEVRLSSPSQGVWLGRDRFALVTVHDDDRSGSVDADFTPGLPVEKAYLQSDGKILFTKTIYPNDFGIGSGRLNPDGTVDKIRLDSITSRLITILPDGKYLAQGVSNIVRKQLDGTFDPTFFGAEIGWNPTNYWWNVSAFALHPDGKFTFAANFYADGKIARKTMLRLNANGSIDQTFVPAIGGASRFALQSDGRLLVFGATEKDSSAPVPGIIRLNEDGTFDPTFHDALGSQYSITFPLIPSIGLQADRRIVVAGNFLGDSNTVVFGIRRLDSNGDLDRTFPEINTQPGQYWDGSVGEILIQPDQKILLSGNFLEVAGVKRFGIARLNPDGSLDQTFDVDMSGSCESSCSRIVTGILLQNDGKIIATGGFEEVDSVPWPGIVRLNNHIQLRFLDTTRASDGSLQFKLSSPPALTAVLEASADLQTWNAASTNTSVGLYLDFDYAPPMSDAGPRFFRVRELPR